MKAIETGTSAKVKGTKNAKMKPGWPTKTTIEVLRRWKQETLYHQDTDGSSLIPETVQRKSQFPMKPCLKPSSLPWGAMGMATAAGPVLAEAHFHHLRPRGLEPGGYQAPAGDYYHIDGYDHTDEEAFV
jgi:hypothetical protein